MHRCNVYFFRRQIEDLQKEIMEEWESKSLELSKRLESEGKFKLFGHRVGIAGSGSAISLYRVRNNLLHDNLAIVGFHESSMHPTRLDRCPFQLIYNLTK